ncbi:MAG: YqeG family HAD IIIA-type phosphatase [Oscillospiraceae bacterium]|nr:YqeG family HAD IIIA-type phosphatase [Oscillospiraceae bacterium]
MPLSFLPRHIYASLTAIDPLTLHDAGVRLLMLDFDNTIVPYTTNDPTDEMGRWLDAARGSDVQICVVSNSKRGRVVDFCKARGIDCITRAKKPFSRGIRECLRKYEMQPSAAALVGDQIYTDVLGANCAGVRSILIPAIHNHNIWLKLRHVAEMPFIWLARKRRVL